MDLSGWIARWSERTPAKVALHFEGNDLTYRRLEEEVATLAGRLRRSGVGVGDRCAYLGPNCPELLETLFAAARLGAIFVPLNARMPPAELQVFVDQSAPRMILAEENLRDTAVACAAKASNEVVSFVAGDGITEGSMNDADVLHAGPGVDASSPVFIAFTSGTTGTPKGAVMTHDALIANARDTVSVLRMDARDEVLTVTPMFHVAGLNLLTTPALSIGAGVTVSRQFDPGQALRDIERRAATMVVAPPPLTLELAAHDAWNDTDLSSLRCVLTGGTSVTERSVRCWQERGVPVVQSYGLTEAGPHVTLVPLDDVPAKSMTAGRPVPSCQVRIIESSGRAAKAGEEGEIAVKGPGVMQGYWQNPEATRDAIPDGWLRTGDLGFFDDDGYLHVIDRIKEVIIVGISNVSPADLEAILSESPEIAAAAVVGRPDEELGEVPVAFVVPAPGRLLTEEGVLALFDGRLAAYKHPRQVIVVDSLPRTSVGKPEKKALRAMARARAT